MGVNTALSSLLDNTTYVWKRLLVSTGKAAWILGTSFLIIALPVIVEMDREAQAQELENQNMELLTNHQANLPGSLPANTASQRK